jgi:hypothetical protein
VTRKNSESSVGSAAARVAPSAESTVIVAKRIVGELRAVLRARIVCRYSDCFLLFLVQQRE